MVVSLIITARQTMEKVLIFCPTPSPSVAPAATPVPFAMAFAEYSSERSDCVTCSACAMLLKGPATVFISNSWKKKVRLLLREKFHAAIISFAGVGSAGIGWIARTKAVASEPASINSLALHVIRHGKGALLTEREVVRVGAAAIGIAFQTQARIRIRLHRLGSPIQRRLACWGQRGVVRIEVNGAKVREGSGWSNLRHRCWCNRRLFFVAGEEIRE